MDNGVTGVFDVRYEPTAKKLIETKRQTNTTISGADRSSLFWGGDIVTIFKFGQNEAPQGDLGLGVDRFGHFSKPM